MLSMTTTEKTPAHRLRDAASSGNLSELAELVREGIPVNALSSFNNTAVLYAALHGKSKCVRFLIENGADVNIANDTGYTPLICAAKKRRLRVRKNAFRGRSGNLAYAQRRRWVSV